MGPRKRKRKVKETDAASTLMILSVPEKKLSEETPSEIREKKLIDKAKRPIFRLPHNAVEKLRLDFAESELPARALRVSLSKQLDLEFEKVNKWFKNAPYLALKARKQAERAQEDVSPSSQEEPISETVKGELPNQMASRNNVALDSPKNLKKNKKRYIYQAYGRRLGSLLMGSGGVGTRIVLLLATKGVSSRILEFNEEPFFTYLLPSIIFNAGYFLKNNAIIHQMILTRLETCGLDMFLNMKKKMTMVMVWKLLTDLSLVRNYCIE